MQVRRASESFGAHPWRIRESPRSRSPLHRHVDPVLVAEDAVVEPLAVRAQVVVALDHVPDRHRPAVGLGHHAQAPVVGLVSTKYHTEHHDWHGLAGDIIVPELPIVVPVQRRAAAGLLST